MENQIKQLDKILEDLALQITDEGKAALKRLISFLRDFELFIANQEVFQPIMIGMFQAAAKVEGIDWNMLEDAIKKVPALDDLDDSKAESSTPEADDEITLKEIYGEGV